MKSLLVSAFVLLGTAACAAPEVAGAYVELSADGSLAGSDVGTTEMYYADVDDWLGHLHGATTAPTTLTVFDKSGTEIGTLTR
ncbi:hypothetical protein CDES_00840 [Corynebacterium deserti GIMN1.010]|uniref:Secreted protein n=1 Tax=Corynebacterium deserti GIMN1.010 TaxID=931089 RepID=A0A0M5ILH6_9CORY|nr:hypothetical protein [Corynebacterium deserti]ALC04648.1 hypothetical protein CDES_00840 [Corynebacterium deserti GIMN1.010]